MSRSARPQLESRADRPAVPVVFVTAHLETAPARSDEQQSAWRVNRSEASANNAPETNLAPSNGRLRHASVVRGDLDVGAVAGACLTSNLSNVVVQHANSSIVPLGSFKYRDRTKTSPLSVVEVVVRLVVVVQGVAVVRDLRDRDPFAAQLRRMLVDPLRRGIERDVVRRADRSDAADTCAASGRNRTGSASRRASPHQPSGTRRTRCRRRSCPCRGSSAVHRRRTARPSRPASSPACSRTRRPSQPCLGRRVRTG